MSDIDEFLEDVGVGEFEEAPVKNYYATVADFVDGFLSVNYARPVSAQHTTFRWCPYWWEHAEAIARLEALWTAWEAMRLDPTTGRAAWWRDYCDPTMNALCNAEGPFRACSDTQHQTQPNLPLSPPPHGLFP
jgi:hypothetical protein